MIKFKLKDKNDKAIAYGLTYHRFIKPRIALNVGFYFQSINYDKLLGTPYDLNKRDGYTIRTGVNYYFNFNKFDWLKVFSGIDLYYSDYSYEYRFVGCFSSDEKNYDFTRVGMSPSIGLEFIIYKRFSIKFIEFFLIQKEYLFDKILQKKSIDFNTHFWLIPNMNIGLKLQTSNIITQTSNIISRSYKLRLSDNQPFGVYFLRVRDDKGRVGVGKFVME